MTKRILKLPKVIDKAGLSRSSIYSQISQGTFPQPISLGARGVGWIEDEIDQWINDRAQQREACDVMA